MTASTPIDLRTKRKTALRSLVAALGITFVAAVVSPGAAHGAAAADETELLRTAIKLACRVESAEAAASLG